MKDLLVYGASGFGREVAGLVDSSPNCTAEYSLIGFVDDTQSLHGTVINGHPVLSFEDAASQHPGAGVVLAIANSEVRERLAVKCSYAGFTFPTLIDSTAKLMGPCEVGEGTIICAGNILTTNFSIGRHVQINLDCTIGHDTVIEDYVTLAPGVHVSGCVHIRTGAYLGTGAVIMQGSQEAKLVVGRGAIVGAQAFVRRNVDDGQTVVGVPAKPRE